MGVLADKELAKAAAQDAGNRSMRRGGRSQWNEDDFNEACDVLNRLLYPQPTGANRD